MSSEPKNHWERYVTPKLPELVKKLEPSLLLAELRACGLLTSEDCSTLRHECSKEEDRSRKLLFDILPRRGNDAFDRFCHVIGKVDGQRHILKEVLQVETMTKPSCKEDEKTPPQKGAGADQIGTGQLSASSRVNSTVEVADTTDGNSELEPILASQGWKYDAFLCHAGEDKMKFVGPLTEEMRKKHQIVSFFDADSLSEGRMAQTDIAEAIIRSPLFVVILSHKFKGKRYPAAEVKAALEFNEQEPDSFEFNSRYKKIIPIFYKLTPRECSDCDIKILKILAGITGIEKKHNEDVRSFVTYVAQKIGEHVKAQKDRPAVETLPEMSPVRIRIKEIFDEFKKRT